MQYAAASAESVLHQSSIVSDEHRGANAVALYHNILMVQKCAVT